MIEHPNSFLVHQCLQAVSNGDTETLRALWAEDIVWHVKGSSPWHGEIVGHDAIFEYLAELGEVDSGDYQVAFEIEDVMIGEERASIILHLKASLPQRPQTTQSPQLFPAPQPVRDGMRRVRRPLDVRFVLLARIAGRRVHEVITIPLDADRIEAFWRGHPIARRNQP